MDRLAELTTNLTALLEELKREVDDHEARGLLTPIAWLEEANGWLKYELTRFYNPERRDPVPFTYIPVDMRK